MRRFLVALLFFSALGKAATFKLYLSDGSYHAVREYKVQGDRVRYYSVERGDWEEIPTTLVDLKKTESEKTEHEAASAEEARLISEEDKAARALQDEVLKIPQDPGVYTLDNGTQLRIFKLAESKYHSHKGRSILKVMSPIPLVPGKGTVEIDNPHSLNILTVDRPDFYIQLSTEQNFALVKVTPHAGVRVVEQVSVLPVTNEAMEEVSEVPVFRKQLTESSLYKVWPKEPLAPGEYAMIEYTPGKMNAQVWDFAIKK